METSKDATRSDNSYMFDHESGAEMVRLLDQDRLVTKAMGGLLPARSNDFTGIERILDVGCGPAGWTQEVAFAHQDIDIVGIDISEAMIEYARAQAAAQGLENAQFRVMDITKTLDFPDNSFDFVNARLLGFFSPAFWPKLLQEYLRVTRPGGLICLTETEMGLSNSAALEKWYGWFFRALWNVGQSFSPNGQRLNITAVLASLLRRAGCRDVRVKAYAIDWSLGSDDYYASAQDYKAAFQLLQPFFINAKVATKEEIEQAYEQFQVDLLQDDFSAIHYMLSAWGEKP